MTSQQLIDHYKRVGVYITLNDDKGVTIEQRILGNKILTISELIDRAKQVYPGLGYVAVVPYGWHPKYMDAELARYFMEKHSIAARRIVLDLGIDKATISVLLSGKKQFTKPLKAAFFYYFKAAEYLGL